MEIRFSGGKIIVRRRKNGVQPAIFIIKDGYVYMICITPSMDFDISNEGVVGERYDENGKWVGG